jgi:hypothetical protein
MAVYQINLIGPNNRFMGRSDVRCASDSDADACALVGPGGAAEVWRGTSYLGSAFGPQVARAVSS